MNALRRIILIMTDTQRTDMLGCYGNRDMITPNLDRLAGLGMRFDKAYTCQPVCGPARSALFTGLYPHSNGSWANCMPLGDSVRTVGQRLQQRGVHAAYIGKWHLDGGDYFGLGQCPDGWDPRTWYDMRCYLDELTPQDRIRSRKTATHREGTVTEEFTYGHRCADRALDFLERHSTERFFLVVSFDEPHDPCLCPPPYSEMYRNYEWPKRPGLWDRLEHKPEHQRIWADRSLHEDKDKLKIMPADFLGCNSFIDYEIGRVLNAIERWAPDALVIYTSDHGDALGVHCLGGKGPAMYDEITRVPLIMRWPGVIPPGSLCPHPVSHIHLTPTILDAFGLGVPKRLEGGSLLDALAKSGPFAHDAVFMEFGRYEVDHDGFGGFQPIRAVVDGRYKLVINLMTSDELYDLASDPDETANLIDSPAHVAARNRLHDRILDWMNATRDPFRGYYWERRPWRTDAPPATWRYTGMTRQRENEDDERRQLDYSTGMEIKDAVRPK